MHFILYGILESLKYGNVDFLQEKLKSERLMYLIKLE